MQKECVSRQPEVGARALTQGVKIGDVGISKRNSTGAKAFTLAEVLLTLAIIGVVAALTIPAVVTKVTKDQYVTGLKKAHNTIKSVEQKARQEYGDIENWDWSAGSASPDPTAQFEKYFLPYFDVLKNCGATEDKGCFPEGVTGLNGDSWANLNNTSHYKIITSDGMSWVYMKSGNSASLAVRGWFFVDVNGLKGPNRVGRDIFQFAIFPSNLGIKPGCSYDNEGILMPTSSINGRCNTSTDGSCCAAKVLAEGTMNY